MLTNFDIYVILNKDFSSSEGQAKKLMKVYADFLGENSLLHSKFNKTCEESKGMEKLNIDLGQAVNYLVRLFYQTEQKYSCSRTKIGKLLSIVAFVYARRDAKAFNETIYRYASDDNEGCGATIKELNLIVDRDIYIPYNCKDMSKPIEEEEIINSADIPQRFQKVDLLSEEVQNEIRKVFIHFGAYNAQNLGKCINPIILIRNAYSSNNEIDLDIIKNLSKDDFAQTQTNKSVIDYLLNSN